MPQISSQRRWTGVSALVVIASFLIINAVLITRVLNPITSPQANIEAMKRSAEVQSPAQGPGLVWRRSLGQPSTAIVGAPPEGRHG
jgi:hypothetical protein